MYLQRGRAGHNGFTLIELLVVVGIIALLAGILLPSLWSARRYSQSSACLSNLRQIGIAMQTYTRSYHGWLPAGPADQLIYMNISSGDGNPEVSQDYREGGGWRPIMNTPWQWGGRRAAWRYLEDAGGNPRDETQFRPLTRQIYRTATLDSKTPVFECPGDDGLVYWERPHAGAWQGEGLGRRPLHELVGNSYFVHLWSSTQIDHKHIQRVRKQPAHVALAYEGILYYNSFMPQNPFLPALPDAIRKRGWHSNDGGYNILFLDGHVEHRRFRTSDGRLFGDEGVIFTSYAYLMDYYR
jgi:prepilin-type N-terminal cleavage/methylation domain-containing protein/prepilin-type processing-associated H-X9-DG protein